MCCNCATWDILMIKIVLNPSRQFVCYGKDVDLVIISYASSNWLTTIFQEYVFGVVQEEKLQTEIFSFLWWYKNSRNFVTYNYCYKHPYHLILLSETLLRTIQHNKKITKKLDWDTAYCTSIIEIQKSRKL